MIADSTDAALRDHPLPIGFVNMTAPTKWQQHAALARVLCKKYIPGSSSFAACTCALPWTVLKLSNPNCGCGYGMGDSGVKALSPCFTGGKTLMVFFSVLVGAFAMGTVGPAISALQTSQQAAARIYEVIDLEPTIGTKKSAIADDAVAPKQGNSIRIDGDIHLKNVKFSYPNQPVFKEINLTIKEGETVALVGGSGCGKRCGFPVSRLNVSVAKIESLLSAHLRSAVQWPSF